MALIETSERSTARSKRFYADKNFWVVFLITFFALGVCAQDELKTASLSTFVGTIFSVLQAALLLGIVSVMVIIPALKASAVQGWWSPSGGGKDLEVDYLKDELIQIEKDLRKPYISTEAKSKYLEHQTFLREKLKVEQSKKAGPESPTTSHQPHIWPMDD